MKPLASLDDDEFTHLVQRAVALPEAPDALVRSVIALFPPQPTTTLKDVAQAALRLVTAALTFDSWATPGLATGMRSGTSSTRHLLFSTMGRDIDLRISPEGAPQVDRFALTGQVLGIDETGIVELTAGPDDGGDEGNVRTTALDAFGEFRLDAVLGGTYQITLRLSGDAIQLPPIVVGERPT